MKKQILVAAAAAVASFTAAANAGLISGNDDLMSGFIEITYNATTHAFEASGDAGSFARFASDPSPVDYTGGIFDLTATISNTGVVSAAQLTVTAPDSTLLFNASGAPLSFTATFSTPILNIFEFTFTQQGASPLDGIHNGTTIGLIITGHDGDALHPGVLPSFQHSFDLITGVVANGTVDTFRVVPLPSAALSGSGALVALAGVGALRRRRAARA